MRGSRALLLALVAPGLALGHDLWLARDGDALTLLYGHQASGHEGGRRIEYPPAQVQRVLCVGADGREAPAEVSRSYPVTVRGPCAAAYALTSSGYWTKTVHGTRNVPRDEAGPAVDSWLSYEGVKRIDDWGPALAAPLTRDLELVPLEDPLALAPGDKLHLRVTDQGVPRAGVTVAYDGKPRGETDSEGRVNVRLRAPGLQIIQASVSEALASAKADRVVRATSLVFDLP